MLKIETIDKTFYISHQEIARTMGEHYAMPAGNTQQLENAIKGHLVRMQNSEQMPEESVITRELEPHEPLSRLADLHAFYALAQIMQFEEDYCQPILVALGEWGKDRAMEVQAEYAKQTEAAA